MQYRINRRAGTLRKIVIVLSIVFALALMYFIAAIYISPPEVTDTSVLQLRRKTTGTNQYTIGKNWLRKSNSGLWEMYVEGDGFERGVINGKLTKDLAELQETVFINQIKELVPSENYLNFLKYFVAYFNRKMPEHISEESLQEIYGVSLSASDKFDRLAPKYYRLLNYHSAHDIGHALQDKNMTVGCTAFGVWKDRTSDGKLLVGRNFDFFAGEDFAKNKIVCFTKPDKGNPFMYVTWAGFTGVVSGMNSKGLTVTINASKSDIPKSAATPISLLAKEILQYSGNIAEAWEIAKSRQTFVSESILIGSAADKKTAIIEKTPSKSNLYFEEGNEIVCSNHFRSKMFQTDFYNNKNIIESSSLYRKFRMQQLLNKTETFTPAKVATVLRDQNGLNERPLGLTNEKGVNQLLAHHSIIFKPEDGLVWVSASPFQLGKYMCYDLNKIFSADNSNDLANEICEQELTIPEDPFLRSQGYKDLLLFKKIKKYIDFCTKSKYDLKVEDKFLTAFVNSNPDSYFTYWIVGDYYLKTGAKKLALASYQKAITKEVATEKEAAHLRDKIKQLRKENI